MRYPEFLKKNGCIGFVAPSFGCNIEPYKTAFGHALDKFEKMGYRTELGPNCYEGCGIGISNTPEKCGQELMEYYCNDTSDVLISCGGGELMCEDLPYVDFEKIRMAKPKWYLGYSDNTNMTFLLTTLCDVASVYGPCAAAFGMEPWHPAIQDAFDVLTGEKLTIKGYDLYEKEGYEWLRALDHPGSRIRFLNEDRVEDIMEVLAMFDLLITDYSSIYIDYLLLERPMLFLPYDREDYLKTRGFNFDYDEVTPGPKPKSYAEFLNSIEGLLYNEMNYVENRKKIERKFNKIQEPCSEYICRMVKE